MGFSKFLKEIDYGQYKEYLLERFGNHKNIEVSEKRKAAAEAKKDSLFGVKPTEKFAKKVKIDIPSIKSLDYNHPARQYISNRKIPDTFWSEIYWAEDFKNFMDKTFPDHGKEDLIENDPRVVLFFTNREGDITNVAGRVIEKDTPRLRYISIKVSEERKVFGIHRTDLKSTLYVVEGQFDSFFIPNCVSSGDANLYGLGEYLVPLVGNKENIVLVYDNESRNSSIVNQMKKSINRGFRVVIFPSSIEQKDINEMIRDGGKSPEDILDIIESNTFWGLEAKLKLGEWRKI